MKKKVIASILAASMAAMALTGCGGGKTTSEAQGATTDETTASTEAGSTADGAEAPDLGRGKESRRGDCHLVLAFHGRCQWRGNGLSCQ